MSTKYNSQETPERKLKTPVTTPSENKEGCETGCCGGHGKQGKLTRDGQRMRG